MFKGNSLKQNCCVTMPHSVVEIVSNFFGFIVFYCVTWQLVLKVASFAMFCRLNLKVDAFVFVTLQNLSIMVPGKQCIE